MNNDTQAQSAGKRKYPKVLLTLTSIYAGLYVILLLSFFLFEDPDYGNITLETIIIGIAFILFLIGYYFSWKNHLVAGILFLLWWGIMWYLGLFVAETDKGVGVVMGVPMFVIGILFIVYWYRRRIQTTSS